MWIPEHSPAAKDLHQPAKLTKQWENSALPNLTYVGNAKAVQMQQIQGHTRLPDTFRLSLKAKLLVELNHCKPQLDSAQ